METKGFEAEEQLYLASRLATNRAALPAIAGFLRRLIAGDDATQSSAARGQFMLCLIGQKRFEEAQSFILPGARSAADLDIQECFNYAMASWGRDKAIPKDLFLRVVELDRESPRLNSGANYAQCLAISNWAIGRIEVARQHAAKSRASLRAREDFSAWRYLVVSKEDFLSDLDELDIMIATGTSWPAIVRESAVENQLLAE